MGDRLNLWISWRRLLAQMYEHCVQVHTVLWTVLDLPMAILLWRQGLAAHDVALKWPAAKGVYTQQQWCPGRCNYCNGAFCSWDQQHHSMRVCVQWCQREFFTKHNANYVASITMTEMWLIGCPALYHNWETFRGTQLAYLKAWYVAHHHSHHHHHHEWMFLQCWRSSLHS